MKFLIFSQNQSFIKVFHRNLLFIWEDCELAAQAPMGKAPAEDTLKSYTAIFIDVTDSADDCLAWFHSHLQARCSVPVVFITADKNEAYAKMLLKAGGQAVLAKEGLTKRKILNVVDQVTLTPESTVEFDGNVFIDDDRKPTLPGYQVHEQQDNNSWLVSRRGIDAQAEAYIFTHFNKLTDADKVKSQFVILKKFTHPNFIPILDVDLLPGNVGQVYLIQKKQQIGLRQIQPASLPADVLLRYFMELLQGLDTLHQLGFVCGFLHPDYCYLDQSDKIILSLAPMLAFSNKKSSPYVSPEKRRGENIDKRSDYYSLAAVFHYFINGGTAEPGMEVDYDERYAELEKVIEGALVGSAEKRYASAKELQRFIEIKCTGLLSRQSA